MTELTPKELATWLRINVDSIGKWVRINNIPCKEIKRGKRTDRYFIKEEVQEYLDGFNK
jgi:hypothetical protein